MHITDAEEDRSAVTEAFDHVETFLQGDGMYQPEKYLVSQSGREMIINHRKELQYDMEELKKLYEQACRQALCVYGKEAPPVSRLLADALSLGHGMAIYMEKVYAGVLIEQITILQNHIEKERESNNRQAKLLEALEGNIENSPIVAKMKEDLQEKTKDLEALDRILRRVMAQNEKFDRWATVPDCVGCMIDMLREESVLRGAAKLPNDETLRRTIQDTLAQADSKRAANANFYRITDIAEAAADCCNTFTAAQYLKDFEAVSCAGNDLHRAKKSKTI